MTDDEINYNVLKLSGGQQHVAIACTLMLPAPMILAYVNFSGIEGRVRSVFRSKSGRIRTGYTEG